MPVLSLSDLSLYNTSLLDELSIIEKIAYLENSVDWNEIIEVYAIEQGVDKFSTNIQLILPETRAPSNWPHSNCKPGLIHFSYWFRQFFIYFDRLESFTLTNLWPFTFDELFHAFNIFNPSSHSINLKAPIAPNLRKMNLGFFGYHAWSEESFKFFASGILSHVDRIDIEDRCGVEQYWENGNHMEYHKYLEFMGNVYWEGTCATDWVDLHKNKNKHNVV